MFLDWQKDIRYGLRGLMKNPGFTIVATLALALGIGANSAIFTIVDTFLFRPLPFERPQDLVYLYQDSDEGMPSSNSYPAYLDMAAEKEVFTGTTAIIGGRYVTWLRDSGSMQRAAVSWVTSSSFSVLGLRPLLGRVFEPAEDNIGGSLAAILSHRTWQRDFSGDPGVLGRILKISGAAVTVIGVGPPDYGGVVSGHTVDFWLSISSIGPTMGFAYAASTTQRRADHWFNVIARLRQGISPAKAQAAMNVLAACFAPRMFGQANIAILEADAGEAGYDPPRG
jgi:putative ABC transport system permease protein